MVVVDGKVALEQDAYSFQAWAGASLASPSPCWIFSDMDFDYLEQALGPLIVPLAAPLGVTQKLIQLTAKIQLDAFMLFNPL
jgi:hypothetical protein